MKIDLTTRLYDFKIWAWLADPRYIDQWEYIKDKSKTLIYMDETLAPIFKSKFKIT